MAYAMTHRVYKVVGRHRYAYEYESYWDPKRRRSHQRMVRYLGPCDSKGRILTEPKTRLESIHSAFPVGPLAVFHAAAQQLRVQERIQEVLDVDEERAATLLTLGLNQATARVPLNHLSAWVRASPLPTWLSLDAEKLTPRSFEEVLSALCHLTSQKTWEDRGQLLQQELTHAWRGSSREPAGRTTTSPNSRTTGATARTLNWAMTSGEPPSWWGSGWWFRRSTTTRSSAVPSPERRTMSSA